MTKIELFNELHKKKDLLFLGNAWDTFSAMTLEKIGFKAIGTTSWGIADSLGFADGELLPFDKHLEMIKGITENVSIPVSADIESGYSEDVEAIVYNVLRTADVGVAGINIEDSMKKQKELREIGKQCDILTRIRTSLDNNGFKDFYVNARIDTYLQMENPFLESLERANAYVESGASGIFLPGLSDENEINEIVINTNAPLNVLSIPGLTNCHKLNELGVKRFSFGNALSDKVFAYIEKSAKQLLELESTSPLYED